MIKGYKIDDADAHVNAAPQMWEDMPAEFAARRPRPAIVHDGAELAAFTAGWLTDGRSRMPSDRACSRPIRRAGWSRVPIVVR